jgi:hypothetical protein
MEAKRPPRWGFEIMVNQKTWAEWPKLGKWVGLWPGTAPGPLTLFVWCYLRESAFICGFKITLPGSGGSSMRGNGGPEGDDGERERWPKETKEMEKRNAR